MTKPLILSTAAYNGLAASVADHAPSAELGDVERKLFPDGERYLRIATPVAGRDVVVIGGTISDACTLELYDLACGVSTYGANRLTMVIPYFGYSTMERAILSGEVVTAKARARLLSSIPSAAAANRVMLIDLHVEGLTHYFEGNLHPIHLYGKEIVIAAARAIGGSDFILACTDAGRAKWVESLASDLGVSVAFVYKRRVSGSQTQVTGVSAHVSGEKVIIYDDMIRTGGSLIGAARAYRDAGAAEIHAICTHGLFTNDAAARLEATGLFQSVTTTDTHPASVDAASAFVSVKSVAPLIARAIEEPR